MNHRNTYIDLLRGIAISLVLILHFNLAYQLIKNSTSVNSLSSQFLYLLTHNGNYGVTIFFAISGFLITTTSLKRFDGLKHVSFKIFYRLRLARIMPCLILMLSVILIFNFFPLPIFKNKPDSPSLLLTLLSILSFWHNYLMEMRGYFNYCLNILWSLSVEEVFYIAFPICCYLLKPRFMVLLWAALIIIGPITRYIYRDNEIVALYGYFSCFDAIAMGCCAAMIARKFYFSGFFWKMTQFSAVLLMICVYFYKPIMENIVFGISLIAFATSILLVAASQASDSPKVNYILRGIGWLGQSSYELYLFHIIILALLKTFFPMNIFHNSSNKLFLFLIFIGLSVLTSSLIERYFSQPMNNFIKKSKGINSDSYVRSDPIIE